jgi:hypothetical protein
MKLRPSERASGASLVRVIERQRCADHSGSSGAELLDNEEAALRHEFVDFPRDAARVTALRSVGTLCEDDACQRVHEFVVRQQAEIGEPLREIEVAPVEEPVPEVAPVQEPEESPAPVQEPERVPA